MNDLTICYTSGLVVVADKRVAPILSSASLPYGRGLCRCLFTSFSTCCWTIITIISPLFLLEVDNWASYTAWNHLPKFAGLYEPYPMKSISHHHSMAVSSRTVMMPSHTLRTLILIHRHRYHHQARWSSMSNHKNSSNLINHAPHCKLSHRAWSIQAAVNEQTGKQDKHSSWYHSLKRHRYLSCHDVHTSMCIIVGTTRKICVSSRMPRGKVHRV